MGGRATPLCRFCGHGAYSPPDDGCKDKAWHKKQDLVPEEVARDYSRTCRKQIGAAVSGEIAARLYVLAYENHCSVAEQAGRIITRALQAKP